MAKPYTGKHDADQLAHSNIIPIRKVYLKMNKVKKMILMHQEKSYVLLWKNRDVNVVVNKFAKSVAKFNMLYSAESLASVMFFG